MFTERLILADHHAPTVAAWRETFAPFEGVEVHEGDFFLHDADAMVSPANSFGIMDGGIDLAIRDTLGRDVQRDVQARILEEHHGEIPVGVAEIVPTRHPRWPFLVVAPTMRVPENAANTLSAYLAFRAALLAVVRHNRASEGAPIRSMLVSGLATGVGGMDPRRCAAQMRIAYDHVRKPARIASYGTIHEVHKLLKSSS